MTYKKNYFLTFALFLLALNVSASNNLAGDWQGELTVSGQKIEMIIHLKSFDNSQIGLFDVPAQGATGIAMSQVVYTNNQLHFEISSMNITYEGTFDPQAKLIKGKFNQGTSFDLDFKRISKNVDIIGDWNGQIEMPGLSLTYVVHINEGANGLTATTDSPDQNAFDRKVDAISFEDGILTFTMQESGVQYKGKLSLDKSVIEGSHTQSGQSFNLNLSQKPLAVANRPQTPTAPFNYKIENLVVENSADNTKLAGTLTKPNSGVIKATAILISGSGPQDRDESIFQHKPFFVIADYLTKQGYAVLRLDDRGTGESSGNFKMATTVDFAGDIDAAVSYLKSRQDTGKSPVGLIGHSEGGMIAPMVAAKRKDIAFLVLLAGPGIPTYQLLAEQSMMLGRAMGAPQAQLELKDRHLSLIFKKIAMLPISMPINDEIQSLVKKMFFDLGITDSQQQNVQLKGFLSQMDTPWFRYFLSYNPSDNLSKVSAPLLALNGSLDLQISATSNLEAINSALSKAEHNDFEALNLPKLNHLFQTSETGLTDEYKSNEETFSPVALSAIGQWLNQRFK
jgi:uncharacterized protein